MVINADEAIQKFYDRMWGKKKEEEPASNSITLAKKYTRVLDEVQPISIPTSSDK